MNSIKIVALALIVAGILGLAYGGFSYTKDTTVVKIGTFEISAKEKETVNIPLWAGIGAIVVGGLLLEMGGKKGCAPHGPDASPQGNVDRLLLLRGDFERANFDHRGVFGVAEAPVGKPEDTGHDQRERYDFD